VDALFLEFAGNYFGGQLNARVRYDNGSKSAIDIVELATEVFDSLAGIVQIHMNLL
jgi:hypothetical protein